MAGLEAVRILNEPTAASLAYGEGSRHIAMVYDLGGGTFDVTVMEIRGNEFLALATDGDVQLGGQDWDQRLVDYVAREFIRTCQLDPREDPNTAGRLWRECEDAKRTLSARNKVSISCDYKSQAVRVDTGGVGKVRRPR